MRKRAILSVLSIALVLIGCSNTQIQDSITVAAQVATSAAAIVAPADPQLGADLNQVGSTLKDVSALYAAYSSAAAADKPGIAGKLQALLSTISNNLSKILADAHIKNPELVEYITVAVAVVNTTVVLITKHVPQATTSAASVRAASAPLPVLSNAKSANDLAKEWNSAVGADHPQAVVRAPQHRKMGIF